MGPGMKVVRVKMQWESGVEELGWEREFDEVGVRIERCNGLDVPWS